MEEITLTERTIELLDRLRKQVHTVYTYDEFILILISNYMKGDLK